MHKDQKLFLGLVGVAMIGASVFLGLKLLSPENVDIENPSVQAPAETPAETETPAEKPAQPKAKEYVNIVFIGQNENHEEIYKIVKREYSPQIDG